MHILFSTEVSTSSCFSIIICIFLSTGAYLNFEHMYLFHCYFGQSLYYLIWVIINDEYTTSVMALLLSDSSILPLFLSYSLVCYSTIKLHTQLRTVDFISRPTTCIRVDENREFDASLKRTDS